MFLYIFSPLKNLIPFIIERHKKSFQSFITLHVITMIKNKYNYKNSSIKETYTRQLEPGLGSRPFVF